MTKTSSPTSPEAARRLVVDLPCGKKSLARARQKVIKFATDHGFSDDAEDVALATQEALKNIIQHACPADNNMHFECLVTDDALTIDVTDQGRGFDTTTLDANPTQPMALHGRGFQLIKGLMDTVDIMSDEEGTMIHMEKKRKRR
ncbi:MAG: ATP-binding protein [Candidatus Geothermincolia bacterium]